MLPIAKRLEELRTERGLTQAELADKAGVRRATVSDWENEQRKRPVFDVLEKLAKALGVEPGDLLAKRGRRDR
jgi:transcriptional regulator with XRE-family HTH domain